MEDEGNEIVRRGGGGGRLRNEERGSNDCSERFNIAMWLPWLPRDFWRVIS